MECGRSGGRNRSGRKNRQCSGSGYKAIQLGSWATGTNRSIDFSSSLSRSIRSRGLGPTGSEWRSGGHCAPGNRFLSIVSLWKNLVMLKPGTAMFPAGAFLLFSSFGERNSSRCTKPRWNTVAKQNGIRPYRRSPDPNQNRTNSVLCLGAICIRYTTHAPGQSALLLFFDREVDRGKTDRRPSVRREASCSLRHAKSNW